MFLLKAITLHIHYGLLQHKPKQPAFILDRK